MKIVLLGPPGAGKGTQAELLSARFRVQKVSTGDLLRNAARSETKLGKVAKKYMDEGSLVPDDILIELVRNSISEMEGFILDGFPRNLAQAEALSSMVDRFIVVHIDVDEEEIVERLSKRRMCRCGASYHLRYYPPKKEGVCDKCGFPLYQRDDDKEDVVRERLKVYKKETQPLLDFYSSQGILRIVNGNRRREEIFDEICRVISSP
jgi:adenylate kinase